MLTAVGSGGATLNRIASDPLSAEKKAAYALIIDTAKCVGCGACVTACNLRNHLPEGQSYVHILSEDAGDSKFLPVQCQHCASPPCAHVCPTNATYVRDDGVVQIDEKLCVGCKYCMVACPYQARIYDEERGVADKCWLCLDYVLDGKEPACVQACVLGARLFGRMDDTTSEVVQLINSGRAKPLQPELGTEPAVLRYIIE
ncbi:MAG: 4Fe-4S dicluster domain-containing protein [Chloroflexi bacterium]|nr:4Fe-4S dicluster domain-containing protein [Chloroflexota bacterium]MBU1746592.1 4Fe-4S dicluster domain-containing protein [Chloroflexota bacterium]MBU1877679.1 4Fe-4S dicluster domain-containing protein [Chloroflexota bacterium]